MDPERFDRQVQSLSITASRRRGVVALLGGLLAASLLGLDLEAKQHRHAHKKRKTAHGDGRLTGQIAGGTPVPQGKYPFAASIRASVSGGSILCTGSLISPSHVLTAAHCTYDRTAGAFLLPSAYSVVVGQVDRTS